MDNPRLPILREKTTKLPSQPGVYIMRDSKKEIIYIGKAKALVNRVGSYFRNVEAHAEKVYKMVENAYDFDYIVTSSEFEALVLECSMIKLHKPKYNILLKDDKGYNYIRVGKEPYARITTERIVNPKENADFLGPFLSSFVTNQTVEEVNKIFMLPTCRRKFPEDFRKERPCLNYHIKRCMGVCTGRISEEKYREIIAQAKEFMTSNSGEITKRMEAEMGKASEEMNFERAAVLRDRLKAISQINDHQNVVFVKTGSQDAIALVQNGNKCTASMIKIRGQRLVDKLDFQLGEIESLASARREFMLSYYGSQVDIPKAISIDGEFDDSELVQKFLSEKAKRQVQITVPERGDRLKLVDMARQNAAQTLSHSLERTGKELNALDELARLLGLDTPPEYIECYDISNMGEETRVAGMIVFENGRPLKSAYRKFNIKNVVGIDDYGSMREIISRRLVRYNEEKISGEGFGKLPDLILLDGGKGHVNAVAPILEDMGFDIPLYGLVKDRSHRTRAIATNGGEISIQSNRSAFTLLSKIQDEVHRFAITHMKNRHSKNAFESTMSQISGMGNKRIKALLLHFKTQKAIKEASLEELKAVKGMTQITAENVYNHFNSTAE